jgi:hypothetical protein
MTLWVLVELDSQTHPHMVASSAVAKIVFSAPSRNVKELLYRRNPEAVDQFCVLTLAIDNGSMRNEDEMHAW